MDIVLRAAGAAAGFYLGGKTGAMIGWTIGGMLAPKKSQSINNSAQVISDLRVPGAEYGQCIPFILGGARVAGQTWWNSDRRPITNTTTTTSGGKGDGGTTVTTTTITYDMDVLYGLSDNEIIGVRRVWMDGKLIYTASDTATDSSLQASASTDHWTRMTVYTGASDQLPDPTYETAVGTSEACAYRGRGTVFIQGLQLGESGRVPVLTFEIARDGVIVDADPELFDPATQTANIALTAGDLICTTTAHGGSLADGCFGTVGKDTTGSYYIEFELLATVTGVDNNDLFLGIAENTVPLTGTFADARFHVLWRSGPRDAPNPDGFIYAEGAPTVYREHYTDGDILSFAINIPTGNFWLRKNGGAWIGGGDPSLSTSPTGNSPRMMTTANFPVFKTDATNRDGFSARMIALEDDFVYSLPSGFLPFGSIDIQRISLECTTVQAAQLALCERAGLTASQVDVTQLAAITRDVCCLAVTQVVPMRQPTEMMMSTYFYEMLMSGTKLTFVPRGAASAMSIPYADIGASEGTSDIEPLPLKLTNDLEIPSQIALTYINVDDDYQTDTQYSDRLISATSKTVSAVTMGIGMSPSEAKMVVDVMLLDLAASDLSATFSVLGDYCALEPTDVVTLTDRDDNTYRMRIVKKTDAYPIQTFEVIADDASILSGLGITSIDYAPQTEVDELVDTLMELMDIPLLQDQDNYGGIYVVAKGSSTTITFPGAAIFKSADNVDYTRAATVNEAAVFGACTTILGSWTGPRMFDLRNSVTVNVGSGTLETSTRGALLDSFAVNAMLVGSELIQFEIATLVSAGVYTLTNLLRGMRGTEWAMTGHTSNERCVLLSINSLRRVQLQNSELGLPRYYKGVTLGRALSTADEESFTDTGIALKPFSPADIRAARDASNNITFTLQRRSRMSVRMIGSLGISVPLGEDSESYRVLVYSVGYATLLRTINATSLTISYSAAEQTADGLTPGNSVSVRAYQLSQSVGLGYALEAVR